MGSVAKAIKKVSKRIKKPLSKITKGIARGIAKVGKSVMRGVGKLSAKLGPIGMIALSIAMPYALGALGGGATGGLIGRTMMQPYGAMGSTGWLNSSNVFLKSIGQVGNAIRTGYTATTGKISGYARSITDSISKGFSNLGKGDNIFSRISNGAKNLFKNSRLEANKFKPFSTKGGTADVMWGQGPAGSYGTAAQTFTSEQAASMIEQGIVQGSDIAGQTLGKGTNWITKTNKFDQAVTNAINDTYKDNVMSTWSNSSKRAFNDYKRAAMRNRSYVNDLEIGELMQPNLDFSGTSDALTEFNFSKSGDFAPKIGAGEGPRNQYGLTSNDYEFVGDKSFNVKGKSTLDKIKKGAKGVALDKLKESLLKPTDNIIPDVDWSLMGDTTQQTEGATTYGGTNIFGSSGGSLLEGVYDKDQQERILNYYRHMNIVGSH